MSNETDTEAHETGSQYFTVTIDGQVMDITFRPYRFANYGHLEFISPHKPLRRIPVSETGYFSHFFPMDEIEASEDIEIFIRELAIATMKQKALPYEEDERQLTLF